MVIEPITPTEREAVPPANRSAGVRGLVHWVAPLLVVVPLMLLLNFGYQLARESAQTPILQLVVNGEVLQLDAAAQQELAEMLPGEITAYERDVHVHMRQWIDAQLDHAFAALEVGVDPYLDWHFSAGGSYLRLLAALTGNLDDWTRTQVQNRLVEASRLDDKVAALESGFANELSRTQRERVQFMQEAIYDRFAAYRQEGAMVEEERLYTLDMDGFTGRLRDSRLDTARLGASLGTGIAGGMMARRVVTGAAMQQGRAIVARFLARLGVQAGRSAAIAGGAAGASAPATGPAAVVVGGVVFAGTMAAFIGTEYLALNAQEKAQRPQLEAQLRADIAATKQELSQQLQQLSADSTRQIAQGFITDIDTAQAGQAVPERYRIFDVTR